MGRATTPGNSVSCRKTRGEDRGKHEGRAPYGDAWMARSSLRRSRVRQVGRAAADHGDIRVVHDGLTDRDELGVDVLGPHIAVMGGCHWPDVQPRPTAACAAPLWLPAAWGRAEAWRGAKKLRTQRHLTPRYSDTPCCMFVNNYQPPSHGRQPRRLDVRDQRSPQPGPTSPSSRWHSSFLQPASGRWGWHASVQSAPPTSGSGSRPASSQRVCLCATSASGCCSDR